MIRNARGLSMVEVMVAAGLVGGIALAVMKLSENMKGVEGRSSGVMDSRELLSEIRVILENEKNCRLSLNGPTGPALEFRKSEIDEPGKEEGLAVELWIGNADGTERTIKKFFEGAELGKAKINSLRLFMNNQVGADYEVGSKSDLGILRVGYSFQGQGKKILFRDFLMNVDFKTNASGVSTILGCERSGVKSLCDSLNLDYNPETQRCFHPLEVCDDWQVIAEENWSGWKEGACTRLDGGYVQSLIFGQSKNGINDSNSLKIRCCYSKKYHLSNCYPPVQIGGTDWWEGSHEVNCTERPKGIIRKIEFFQGTSENKDTNGMKVQCCYPN